MSPPNGSDEHAPSGAFDYPGDAVDYSGDDVDFEWVALVLERAVASLRPVLDRRDQIFAALDVGIAASGIAGRSQQQEERIQLRSLLEGAVGLAATEATLTVLQAGRPARSTTASPPS